MSYRLFYGIAASEAEYRERKPLWITQVFGKVEDALSFALEVDDANHTGRWSEIPWEIEGDDGFRMNRNEIALQIQLRRGELLRRPKVY